MGLADDSINGRTVDLQIDNFLEWGPDHQGFVFIEMVQKESLAKWFPSGFPSGSHDHCQELTSLMPSQQFYVGPVGASLWCLGSAPGHSKQRPGFSKCLLIHL